MTVLEPICGAARVLCECLCSFVEHHHSRTQLTFGLRDHMYPAIPVIGRVINKFPVGDLALVIDPPLLGTRRAAGAPIETPGAALRGEAA
jgi:hypothetical protein